MLFRSPGRCRRCRWRAGPASLRRRAFHAASGLGGFKEDTPAVLTATAENGVTVTMTAPKESLPASAEELSLRATVVEDKDAKELIEKEVSENDGADVRRKSMLFDIKLMHNGEEAQPAGPVGISFTGIETPKDDAQVFHVDGQARKAEEVTASEKRDGTIQPRRITSPYTV